MAEKAKAGLPLTDVLVIDGHAHMGYWANFHIPAGRAVEMLTGMDTLGISYACVSAMASIGPDYKLGNDMVKEAMIKYPDRFIGYVTVNPNYEKDMRGELDRCFAYSCFKGIKLHASFHGQSIDSKHYHTAYKTAEERQCPVLIHTWGKHDVSLVKKMAGQYPRASFIMGHSGGDVPSMADTLEVVNRLDNVYADLTISSNYEGNVEWFVREAGSEKIVFGTDTPFFDPRVNFGRVAMAKISEAEKRNIFGLNMKRLLKLT